MVPPDSVLEDALTAARTIYLRPAATPARTGIVDRLLQRQRSVAAAPAATLSVVASSEAFIRVARLGNVTGEDARILALALDEFAATWPAPVVHVDELVIDLSDSHLVVNARLGGDITGLKDVFRGFNEAAKAQHFFLDRRSFRPEFTVASVSLPTDPTFLDRLEWEADSYRGPDWRVTTCSLMSAAFGHDAPTFSEVETLHLGVDSG